VRLTTAKFSLRHNRKLLLARPWASASGGGLRLARPQGSASASASEGGLRLTRPQGSAPALASEGGLHLARPQGLASTSTLGGIMSSPDLGPQPQEEVFASPDPRARPPPRPRKVVSASPDPRAWPQPRPREESRPRPTPASASGGVSASPDLGLGPTAPRRMHHYPTPS
jgi:hypothetical protein